MKAGFVLALLASACPSSGHDLFSNPTGLWRWVTYAQHRDSGISTPCQAVSLELRITFLAPRLSVPRFIVTIKVTGWTTPSVKLGLRLVGTWDHWQLALFLNAATQ